MREIRWTATAQRQIRKLPKDVQSAIFVAVGFLENFPDCRGDIKKLQGRQGFRLRVGRYRVLFDENGHILEVQEVKKRDDNTYR